jgi:hypothetical protein
VTIIETTNTTNENKPIRTLLIPLSFHIRQINYGSLSIYHSTLFSKRADEGSLPRNRAAETTVPTN